MLGSLGFDSTSISKEVKRNRIAATKGLNTPYCNKTSRWPYVCSSCIKKYNKKCSLTKYKYDAKAAHRQAQFNLINSRRGLDIDSESFQELDAIIKDGIDDNKSIYQIKIENNDLIDKSISTLYRYINRGVLTTTKLDLPYAVKFKKRKHNKKYGYSNNTIDRSGHTYLDYLSYIHTNQDIYVWQLAFLGSITTDNNNILSLILPNLQFMLLGFVKNPTSAKVVSFFDHLEESIGTDAFKDLIPVILTDRDPCFNDINGICFSKYSNRDVKFSFVIPMFQTKNSILKT